MPARRAAVAWSKGVPRGERSATTCRGEGSPPSDSTARRMGSAFITIPGPPPNGASSTLRWRSSVNSRRSWTAIAASPASTARPTMPSATGAWTMAGKMVTTSILSIGQLRLHGHDPATLQVDLADEGVRHGDEQLSLRATHHEHRGLAPRHQDVGGRAQRPPLGILHLEPLELVVVVRPGRQDVELVLADAQLRPTVALGLVDRVHALELQHHPPLVRPAGGDGHRARAAARRGHVDPPQGREAMGPIGTRPRSPTRPRASATSSSFTLGPTSRPAPPRPAS